MSNLHPLEYDEKLKDAAAEIKGILLKYDIGGYVMLASPTHSEFLFEVTPTWGGLRWKDKNKGLLRFKSTAAEVGIEKSRATVEKTCHMVYQMRDLCGKGFMQLEHMIKIIKAQVEVEHNSNGKMTPHKEH